MDFAAPHKHMGVDLTVTCARRNSNVPAVGGLLPLYGSLALGVRQVKLDADIRTSSSLDALSIQIVHDYYPVALDDGARLAPMAAELIDCLGNLVVARRFLCLGSADFFFLRS
jgi:hypothetical protein